MDIGIKKEKNIKHNIVKEKHKIIIKIITTLKKY